MSEFKRERLPQQASVGSGEESEFDRYLRQLREWHTMQRRAGETRVGFFHRYSIKYIQLGNQTWYKHNCAQLVSEFQKFCNQCESEYSERGRDSRREFSRISVEEVDSSRLTKNFLSLLELYDRLDAEPSH